MRLNRLVILHRLTHINTSVNLSRLMQLLPTMSWQQVESLFQETGDTEQIIHLIKSLEMYPREWEQKRLPNLPHTFVKIPGEINNNGPDLGFPKLSNNRIWRFLQLVGALIHEDEVDLLASELEGEASHNVVGIFHFVLSETTKLLTMRSTS